MSLPPCYMPMADVNVFVGFALLAMLYSYLLEAVDHSLPHWIRMTIIYRHVLLLIVLVLTLDMVSAARGTPRTSRSDPSAPPTRNLVNQASPHAVKDEIVLEPVSARELRRPLVPNVFPSLASPSARLLPAKLSLLISQAQHVTSHTLLHATVRTCMIVALLLPVLDMLNPSCLRKTLRLCLSKCPHQRLLLLLPRL